MTAQTTMALPPGHPAERPLHSISSVVITLTMMDEARNMREHVVLISVIAAQNDEDYSNTLKAAKALELHLGVPWNNMWVLCHHP